MHMLGPPPRPTFACPCHPKSELRACTRSPSTQSVAENTAHTTPKGTYDMQPQLATCGGTFPNRAGAFDSLSRNSRNSGATPGKARCTPNAACNSFSTGRRPWRSNAGAPQCTNAR